MWIKEVVIDGFKSYANRTVISGWDKQFNAITGLNGTGKSNILDSICFVLGISNLAQVRCHNQTELVYKQGQSRVQKASVTLVFDNADRKSSPVGYEQFQEIMVTRQIVIGGRNKYMINGHTAQLSQVQNLFHSVQLNVNNPHFLIMQGRITKVVNMKPPEVLAMIEEAAGTRMYENKKNAAVKTIEKKQTKVEEINKILVEDITPTLEKLRKERSSFMQWSANNTEIERLERFCVAYQYMTAEQLLTRSKENVAEMEEEIESIKDRQDTHRVELKEKNAGIAELQDKMESELKNLFSERETVVAEQSKELVKSTSVWDNLKETLKSENKALTDGEKAIAKQETALAKKTTEKTTLEAAFAEMEQTHNELADMVRDLQSSQLGINMNDDNAKEQGGLTGQLMKAQAMATDADGRTKGAAIAAKHLKSQLDAKKKQVTAASKSFKTMEKSLATKEAAMAKLEAQLAATSFDANAMQQARAKLEQLQAQRATLKEEHDTMAAKLSRVNFNYSDPVKNFDRSKVKGMVAKLISVKDKKACTALELTAGGKLYQIVVDTQQTGKQLLEKGKLKRRVTIIPLDKISSRTVSADVVKKAQDLVGKDNAKLALSLVGFDDEVNAAMSYVFGRTFICADNKSAEAVTFAPQIRTRCVTLKGDVFDPSGTLSGGSAPAGGSVLTMLAALNECSAKLDAMDTEIAALTATVTEHATAEKNSEEFRTQFELVKHECELLRTRMGKSQYAVLSNELAELEEQQKTTTAEADEAKATLKAMQAKCTELKQEIKDFEKKREEMMKQMKAQMESKQKELTSSTKTLTMKRAQVQRVALQVDELTTELAALVEAKATIVKSIEQYTAECAVQEEAVMAIEQSFKEANDLLQVERTKMNECESRINAMRREAADILKQIGDCDLDVKKMTHKIQRMQADHSGASARVAKMEESNQWIASEKHLFGKEHSDYDFTAMPFDAANARRIGLKEEQESLSKRINKKVMGMFEKAECEYEDLMKKRDIILKDKTKIEQVIAELDTKKNEALETTWRKVNKDFGAIFSALLPGAHAKVEPPAGMTVLDGLEVKVAFGNTWKESLTELSGGQRSLLALSLILAMLVFKPAPMYILDEVDAALDLSHTQNIGAMLKSHFPQSQFIVVSLKDGMFNNANVIFRTKFVDGVSAVGRTANHHGSKKAADKENSGGSFAIEDKSRSGKKAKTSSSGKAALQISN